ncbi:hypothetical protein SCOCK_260067 [Actinacidiphila cocklensis]|uniref:Uncharacterized protein n=1 Tax=Actinacidiphila cocklensis TaxID=887465 RepID=A0A9W4DRM7_9ACTN|nr:hypothetical protein SCOCK_260067 [Actinacidiphila cocklensis]
MRTAWPTRAAVSGATPASPATTRETVMGLTPAARATSFIVGRFTGLLVAVPAVRADGRPAAGDRRTAGGRRPAGSCVDDGRRAPGA